MGGPKGFRFEGFLLLKNSVKDYGGFAIKIT
jgi:hypothetical protein